MRNVYFSQDMNGENPFAIVSQGERRDSSLYISRFTLTNKKIFVPKGDTGKNKCHVFRVVYYRNPYMKSEKKILKRYEKVDGRYIIQISTNHFRDLFNKFDRASSFIRRDLDYDLADYLFESASDLQNRPFYIRLNLHAEKQSEELEKKVNQGIDSYFEYESNKIKKRKRSIIQRIFVHIVLAILCIFISYTLNRVINTESFLYVVFVESIVIAAWVLMWPVFSDFIYELVEFRRNIKIYKKLVEAEIKFNYLND